MNLRHAETVPSTLDLNHVFMFSHQWKHCPQVSVCPNILRCPLSSVTCLYLNSSRIFSRSPFYCLKVNSWAVTVLKSYMLLLLPTLALDLLLALLSTSIKHQMKIWNRSLIISLRMEAYRINSEYHSDMKCPKTTG